MKAINWTRILYFIGVAALIIGILDPLEGSVVIVAGSMLMAVAAYLTNDRQWKTFLFSTLLIIIGVSFMFYFSSLGGFGGNSKLSWWWVIFVLPYPAGWIIAIILLIKKLSKGKETRPLDRQ